MKNIGKYSKREVIFYGMDYCYNHRNYCGSYRLCFMGDTTFKAYISMQELLKRIYNQLEKTPFCDSF